MKQIQKIKKGDLVCRWTNHGRKYYVVTSLHGDNVYARRVSIGRELKNTEFYMPKSTLNVEHCITAVAEKRQIENLLSQHPMSEISRPWESWKKLDQQLHDHFKGFVKLYYKSKHVYVKIGGWRPIAINDGKDVYGNIRWKTMLKLYDVELIC